METLQYSIRDFVQECEGRGITIELICGQILGAMKFSGVLSWEKDGDMYYLTEEHEKIREVGEKMKTLGYIWYEDTPRVTCCWSNTTKRTGGCWGLRAGVWRTEMYGAGERASSLLKTLGLSTTRLLIDGEWMPSQPNPALFSLHKYRTELFQHQEHYADVPEVKTKGYRPGVWSICPHSNHQACLDQYFTDGSVQFRASEW